MPAAALDLVTRYFRALNDRDIPGCLSLLCEDVVLDLNQGPREVGREAFALFLERQLHCYRETYENLVILTEPGGCHAACEYRVDGEYLATDEGLPDACGQLYSLTAGAFFEFRDLGIARVSYHFNLPDWLAQID